MKVGDIFVSPTGPEERFPERKMRVVGVKDLHGLVMVDARPVRRQANDRYAHCVYFLGEDGRLLGPAAREEAIKEMLWRLGDEE